MEKIKRQPMKLYASVVLLMLAVLLSSMAGTAQTDSLSYSNETHYDSIVEYLTPMEYAFMFHEETNWLFKASLIATFEYGRIPGNLKLSLEKKIAKGFSLNAVLFNASTLHLGLNNRDDGVVESSLESRWYYKNQKNILDNKPTANLSGAYIALGVGYQKAFNACWDPETGYTNLEAIPIFAKWGVQRRFLKQGYADVGVMAGWNKSLSGDSWSTFLFNTYVEAGLAFTKDKYRLDLDKLCPVLRCHAEDRFLLKTNLVNIINLAYVRESLIGSISPNIEVEFKIGKSPFSINTKLGSMLEYSKLIRYKYEYEIFGIAPQLTIEGRYYYNLHRRMLKGKSGNGLSANYISLGPTYRGIYYNFSSEGNNYTQEDSFIGIKVGTGIQRLISDHLYLDINLGIGYGIGHNYMGNILYHEPRSILDFSFGVGYRF